MANNIPTVPGSEIDVNTPGSGFKANAAALNAPFRGQMEIAGAVSGVADQMESLGADLQRARNVGIAADADLKLRTARQAFLESLRNDNNETEWASRAQEVSNTVRDQMKEQYTGIGPQMRRQLDQAFRSWNSSLQIETQTMAHVQGINRAWGVVKADYNEKLKDGDAPGAKINIDNARKAKLADPGELDQMERDIPKVIARNMIEHGLGPNGNPKSTYDLLKSGAALPAKGVDGKDIVPSKVFTPKELDQITNEARIRMESWQKQNFEGMIKDDADPVTGYVPDDKVKARIDSGDIEPKAGRALINAQDRRIEAQKKETGAALAKSDRDREDLRVHRPDHRKTDSAFFAAIPPPFRFDSSSDTRARGAGALRGR